MTTSIQQQINSDVNQLWTASQSLKTLELEHADPGILDQTKDELDLAFNTLSNDAQNDATSYEKYLLYTPLDIQLSNNVKSLKNGNTGVIDGKDGIQANVLEIESIFNN